MLLCLIKPKVYAPVVLGWQNQRGKSVMDVYNRQFLQITVVFTSK